VNRIFASAIALCLLAPTAVFDHLAAGEEPPVADKEVSTAADSSAQQPERRLRFSFRHTRWIDVLEWLSEQSNLSLVLDAPPPGSFNYSDSKEYTPLEAIDLVNGVLATKGFTLVRRDRMLTLVGLAGGVPRALLPRLQLDDLDDRGKFEMVSVAFPVGRRKIEQVVAEIQVLLGPYGKADPLVASGQILVSDRAGIMRTISAVIESIPEAQPPKKPADSKPEKPELGVYALGGRDSSAVIETLHALFANARFIFDLETDHINAYATPTQHAAITQVFEQMKTGASDGTRPRLEVYPLPELDPTARAGVLSNLAIVAPEARLRYDDQAQRLFVWAKPVVQEAVRNSIVKLLQVTPARNTRSLRVYTLQRADPTTLSTLLQATLPQAKISVDTAGRRLIIHASERDQQTVAQLVEQMDAEPSEKLRAVLRVYPVDRRLADRVTPLLNKMVPKAEVTVDSGLGRVSVVATPADQTQVESVLSTLTEGVANLPQPTVEVVKVPRELRDRFEAIRSLLETQIPKAKLLWDPKTLELTVWAMADDHARVGGFLEQMSRQPATKPDQAIFEVMKIPREMRTRFDSIQTMLAAEIPQAKLNWNPKTLELTVWAKAKEMSRVREVLAQVAKQPALAPVHPTLEVHPLPKSLRKRFESIQSLLSAEVPKAKLVWSPDTTELTVWAMADDHARVREVLAQVAKQPATLPPRKTVIVHTLPKELRDRYESIQNLLTAQIPQATLVWNAETLELTVWALPEDHLRVGELLEQISRHPPTEKKRQLAAYPMATADLSTVVTMLKNVASKAQITADTKGRRVLVWATVEEQQAVENAIRAMGDSDTVHGARSYMSHPVRGLDLALATRLLTERYPGVALEQDTPRSALIALATAAQHEQIDQTLRQMQTAGNQVEDRRVVVYPTDAAASEGVAKVLTALLPGAQVVGTRYVPNVSVHGTAREQQLAAEVVDQWIANSKKKTPSVAKLYPLHSALATDMITQLRGLVPKATLVAGSSSHTILARANEEDHELLAKLVRELDQPATDQRVVEVYQLPGGNIASLKNLLDTQTAAQIQSVSTGSDRVIIRATPDLQEKIKAVILKIAPAMETKPRMVVYSLRHTEPQQAFTVLRAIVPRAVMVVQEKNKSLAVSALDKDHQLIAAALLEIDRPGKSGKSPQATVVPINTANPALLLSLLQRTYSRERKLAFSYDDKTRSIIIVGKQDKHEEIKRIIASVDSAQAGRETRVEVYRLRNVQPQDASVVVRGIVPTATITIQSSSRSLAVTTDGQGHKRIAAAIEALERATGYTEDQIVSVIPIVEAQPQILLQLLRTKYANQTGLTFSYDTSTRSILLVGPADRHQEIKQIIAAADRSESGQKQHVLVYPLGRINGSIAQRMVSQLMTKERHPVTLSFEPNGNKLVVVALDQQHAIIRQALEQLQPPETDFEVYALHEIDPLIAEDAVIGLFIGASDGGSAPVVDTDLENNRLYVRATPEQLQKIRELLTKMGERQLDVNADGTEGGLRGGRSKLRFVPLSGDEMEAIDSIRAVWPKLRDNDLRVLDRKQNLVPLLQKPTEKPSVPQTPRDTSGQLKSPTSDRLGIHFPQVFLGFQPLSLLCQLTVESRESQPTGGNHPVALARSLQSNGQRAESGQQKLEPANGRQAGGKETLPPVYIVPGKRGVTIMSEDTSALDQLENLLSVLAQPQSRGSRRFFVYTLKSSSATRLADTMNKLFRNVPSSGRRSSSRGRASFVADERLNALVVFSNRSDRQEIEELLSILDVEQTPDMQATLRPVVIPLRHAHALTVEKQLRLLYKTQLTAGGKQPAMEIPSGADAAVAAMIQQVNAVRQGPLMTLGTDEDTNSILIVAPPSLIEEVRRFTEELDQTANDFPRRAVRIVPLKKTNAKEMDRALQRILRQRRGRR